MKIQILDAAEQDLVDGFNFYEIQSRGLGHYFLDSVYADMESLHLYYGIHPKHFGYHRLLTKRFPFAIYYRIERKSIRIYAVLDCRKNPKSIRDRLNSIASNTNREK
jgi:plasmid stabilization system protein ParE